MTSDFDELPGSSLAGLGWSDFFGNQIMPDEISALPVRIAAVHRARVEGISEIGPISLLLSTGSNTGDFAVGDWVLADRQSSMLQRRLTRKSVLKRHTASHRMPQLAGANIDTLFIVTSCNEEFDVARLERYLALSNDAGIAPVILLTKADLTMDARRYFDQAAALQRALPVVICNPLGTDCTSDLSEWCGEGHTVALVGSSGVGKSTLVNALASATSGRAQLTGHTGKYAKGRHTTTSRSLHAMPSGGWLIDTPGIRTLNVSDATAGIGELFAEISELAPLCKFRDCTHAHEPGCAVSAALANGTVKPERLARWRTMVTENRNNTPVQNRLGGARETSRRNKPRKQAD